jgi:hypothetical protein
MMIFNKSERFFVWGFDKMFYLVVQWRPVLIRLLLTLALALQGCAAGTKMLHYDLNVKANGCQVTESRPSMFSTSTATVCWDGDGRAIGFFGGPGEPTIAVPLALIGAGGTMIGAGLVGYGMIGASKNLSNIKVNGKIDTSGTNTIKVDQTQIDKLPKGGK